MKKNLFKRGMAGLLSLVMCLTALVGIGTTTAYAAGERAEVYLVSFPRSGDANIDYSGTWGHPNLRYMNGWHSGESKYTTIRAMHSYDGNICYCIEPGVQQDTGDTYTSKDETFWDNLPSDINSTISPYDMKLVIGRIMQYGYTGPISTSWRSQNPADAATLAEAMATQVLIWETVVGERDEDFDYVSPGSYDAVKGVISTAHPLYDLFCDYYDSIEASVQSHSAIPSFMSKNPNRAQSVELEWDGSGYTASGDSTETAEDTQDEPMDDTSNKNSADTVETADNINDTTDINEVNNLSDKVSYLDRMRGDAENALAYDPERKGDWDVVRGRLSDEYRKTSDNLKTLAEGKQAEYEQLRNEYFDALEGADSPEKAARLAELTKRGGELSKEIDTANSRSRYADNFANELSRDLDPSKRTTYEGVGGKSFTDLHQSMIQKQGNAVKDFKGTCGDCSAANTMTALGDTKSEAEVVQRARDLNACVDKKIPSFLPESLKEKMRGSNGGTSVAGRSQILDSFGYDCDNRTNQSLAEISQQIENGKGAIINVDHRVLNKQRDVTAMNPVGTDHALTITGIEKDAAGNAIGLWIHDTGVCSNMGNAFYCNAQDYAVWKSTPNCTVQYVSKK